MGAAEDAARTPPRSLLDVPQEEGVLNDVSPEQDRQARFAVWAALAVLGSAVLAFPSLPPAALPGGLRGEGLALPGRVIIGAVPRARGPRPAAARVGGERRRVAGAQLRPREHSRHHPDVDQLADGLEAEGEVALRLQGRERLRCLRVDADRPQRHGLSPGPELERLRARPLDRQARVASTHSTSRASDRTGSPTATAASTAPPRRTPSRSMPRPGSCSGAAS